MGTPSITKVYDDGAVVSNIYHQCDGFPDSAGLELANFAATGRLVNGIGQDSKIFNGMGCFAAALIAHLKTGPGHIYLVTPQQWGVAYTYEVRGEVGKGFSFVCKDGGKKVIFKGDLAAFEKFCREWK